MKDNVLFYKEKATKWEEALPLGNGTLGAMVYGDSDTEQIQLNEITLWSGYEFDHDNPECLEHIDEIRQLIFDGEITKAQKMCEKYIICKGKGTNSGNGKGHPYGSYETAGELYLDFLDKTTPTNYKRELNLTKGFATVSYEKNDNKIEETVFCSHNKNVTAIKIKATKKTDLKLYFKRENVSIIYDNDTVTVNGEMDPPLGIKYSTFIKVKTLDKNSTITSDNDGLCISFSDYLYITLSTATSYKSEICPLSLAKNYVNKASVLGFNQLLDENIDYFSAIMNRVSIDLNGDAKYEDLDTYTRLQAFIDDKYDDINFITTYFQFGRYLLLSSSSGVLPANLQGLWTKDTHSIWSSDYHININLQMNYWLSETTNLSELNAPLFDYFKMISKHGEKTARVMYNCGGWVAHTTTTPWGFTSPGEHPSWGSYACAGAWCMRHIWEHYLFTEDIEFLKEYYPIIKGCALFFLDYLVEDKKTKYLVTSPSNSPENTYFDPKTNEVVAMCASPTMDNSILYDLFTFTNKSGKLLGDDGEFLDKILKTRDRLPPIKLGSKGQILEWQEEYKEAEPGHRHLSPLYGLHPVELITKSKTPELFLGAKKLIEERLSCGGGHTGWSRAWIVNFYARLFEGDKALYHMCKLLGKSTHKNLFDNHPPFQIDGNFGGSAGLCEMLIQSHEEFINLLPACPSSITKGSVKGLVARGGFVVDFAWDEQIITSVTVLSKLGNKLVVKYNDKEFIANTTKGEKINFSFK